MNNSTGSAPGGERAGRRGGAGGRRSTRLAIFWRPVSIAPEGRPGDSSICGQFMTLTTPAGVAAPVNTISALLNIINNPSLKYSRAPEALFRPMRRFSHR